MVEYTNDKGEVVVGEVQDMISLRNAGLVMIDGQEVPTQNIIGVEGTTEAENANNRRGTTQQEAEERRSYTRTTSRTRKRDIYTIFASQQ